MAFGIKKNTDNEDSSEKSSKRDSIKKIIKNDESCYSSTVTSRDKIRKVRKSIAIYWISMVFAIIVSVCLVLAFSGAFTITDKEFKHTLDVNVKNTSEVIEKQLDELTAYSLSLSEQTSREVESLLLAEGIGFEDLNDNPDELYRLQKSLFPFLQNAFQMGNCSGVYLVLDATINTSAPDADVSRTGMYLRRESISGSHLMNNDAIWFRGMPDVARQMNIEFHNRWNLEFNIQRLPKWEDVISQKINRPADYFFWTERTHLEDTWEDAVLLCVPIVGTNGSVYGVCGVEISALYFRLLNTGHHNEIGLLTTVLAPVEDGKLMLDRGLIGGVDGMYFDYPKELNIHQGRYYNTYTDENGQLIGIHDTVNISVEDGTKRMWAVAELMPKPFYDAYKAENQQRVFMILAVFAFVLAAVFIFIYTRFVRPMVNDISGYLNSERQVSHGMQTLVDYIQSVDPAVPLEKNILPDEVESVLNEFKKHYEVLNEDEKEIIKYIRERKEYYQIAVIMNIKKQTVKKMIQTIYARLDIISQDELLFYMDFLESCGMAKKSDREADRR